jgi:DNA polymerase III subunit delta
MSARRASGGSEPALGEELSPVYMVYGDEQLLVRRTIDQLAERALLGGPAAFNRAEGVAGSDAVPGLLSQARTPPMMGPRRLVVIRELENAKPPELDAMMAYVRAASPSTVLVITGSKLPPVSEGTNRGVRLRNAVNKVGKTLRFEASKQDPAAFVRARCTDAGCTLGRREAELLVEVVGRDLGRLAGEVDKLVAFVGGAGTISSEQVEQVCSLLAETVIFELTDAIVRGQAGPALALAHRLLEEGHAPARILPLVAWQVRQLIQLQDCLRRRADPYDEGIRMPRSKMQAARQSLRRHPLRGERTLELLAGATHTMRTSKAGERHVFEALILELSGQPG